MAEGHFPMIFALLEELKQLCTHKKYNLVITTLSIIQNLNSTKLTPYQRLQIQMRVSKGKLTKIVNLSESIHFIAKSDFTLQH